MLVGNLSVAIQFPYFSDKGFVSGICIVSGSCILYLVSCFIICPAEQARSHFRVSLFIVMLCVSFVVMYVSESNKF